MLAVTGAAFNYRGMNYCSIQFEQVKCSLSGSYTVLRMNFKIFQLAAEFPSEWKFGTKFASDGECDIWLQRTPWGGGKRGGRKTSQMTPLPRSAFGPPHCLVRFPPPSGVVALFLPVQRGED